ncbi:Amino-acid acetyltransferase, mitochondrial [Coemansia sp. RSA 2671]|nr:Amino-acid acetyltransferase, mitochondrial [Coemansia sp. RSA 2675]KAJ2349557.1 Amino-acid acetyltransferase, mitochondrial [Coemansia sp. RSA 2671]
MLSHLRHWKAARRPLAALLSDVGRSNLQLARSRELILSVLSTVPSPREARKFIDSVSGQETLRTQRQFEERQALLASSQAPPGLVAGEFLHAQAARAPTRTLALVCVEAPGSAKLLAQMQRLGVVPVVLPLGSGDYRAAVGRAHALADAVDGEGGRAVPVGGVFHAGGVAADAVAEAVARGIIPVVAPVAADEGQRLGVVGRCVEPLAEALAALERAGRLSVARLIYVGDGLGIASGGAARRLVNLEEDYGRVQSRRMDVVQVMRRCLAILAPTTVGIVAEDPSLVLKGLLSERPPSMSGAVLLRHGFRIQRHSSLATCDEGRLRALLERSFGRTLDAQGYFERLRACEAGIQVIVAGEYQGAVVVTRETGVPYLDKFAVLPEVQGTGMADILWDELKAACPQCLWRSRTDNGVNRWYFDRSNGHWRGAKWVFFWYHGEQPLGLMEVAEAMDVAQRIPASFL